MSGQPWTQEHDAALRAGFAEGLDDEDIADRLRPMRRSVTEQGVRQRRFILKLFRPRGGKRRHPRPSGPQKHCLRCARPFRAKHKFNRLCPSCTVAIHRAA